MALLCKVDKWEPSEEEAHDAPLVDAQGLNSGPQLMRTDDIRRCTAGPMCLAAQPIL